MRNLQDAQELFQRVNDYLDNELSPDAERELLTELRQNPAVYDMLNKEQTFREFIKSRIHRRKASPALIQSIKEKIKISPA
jgi:predicted lactoylglutathione lyase